MLSEEVKERIQSAYRSWLTGKGFRPRHGQRLMIAEIARRLCTTEGEPIAVVEAGTGTGKTVAYALAAIPIAQALDKTLVIATATVALQEQIVLRDLPEIIRQSGLEFSYALAKGRSRYLCLSKLDQLLSGSEPEPATLALYPDEQLTHVGEQASQLYQELLQALAEDRWDGDRDQWPHGIDDVDWQRITTDHGQCSGRRCPHVRQCSFFKAREQIGKVDVIITNHDLVLADLALGGGAILPEPEELIYVFDEAHHLPDKARDHFAREVRVRGGERWLEQGGKALSGALSAFGEVPGLIRALEDLPAVALRQRQALAAMRPQLEELLGSASPDSEEGQLLYRFAHGVVPEAVREQAQVLRTGFGELGDGLGRALARLDEVLEEAPSAALRSLAEQWYPALGGLRQRAERHRELWALYATEDAEGSAPRARWLAAAESAGGQLDVVVHASPIVAGGVLSRQLWARCAGAVLTSATLTSLGRFDRFRDLSGVPAGSSCTVVPSPFDYASAGALVIPPMDVDPGDAVAHTAMLGRILPELLKETEGSLVLFSSRRQMEQVFALLPEGWQQRCLMQGQMSKHELLNQHRERVDQGEGSVLFGLASFAEGIDLPGDYCRHVVIAKIPFAVPNAPIEAALAEWVTARGGNPFMEISVPDASLKLVQACGRLLRNETDSGRITLLDKRLLTRRYGRALLDSLPPFRREAAV